jgi:hypothetical protein
MRVKAITGEFSKYNAYIYPTEGDDISGVVYSGQEVLSNQDNPQQRRAFERGTSLAIMDDINSPSYDEDDYFLEELLYVREDHPVFNIDLIGDWIYEKNAFEPMDDNLARSVMISIKKNY